MKIRKDSIVFSSMKYNNDYADEMYSTIASLLYTLECKFYNSTHLSYALKLCMK